MTLSLADRSTKAQKVKVLPISGRDPDAHRSEMIKVQSIKTSFFMNNFRFHHLLSSFHRTVCLKNEFHFCNLHKGMNCDAFRLHTS